MKKSILILFCCTFFTFTFFAQQENTLPENGNIGLGTLNPSAKLDVNGNVHIDSNLMVKDSILIHKDARIKKNLIVEQNVRFTNLDETNALGNKNFVVIRPNGKVDQIDKATIANEIGGLIYEEKDCSLSFPTWSNGLHKIYVDCPEIKVGIGTVNPNYNLHVVGSSFSNDYFGGNSFLNSSYLTNRMVIGSTDINSNSFGKLLVKYDNSNAGIMVQQSGINTPNSRVFYAEIENPTTEIIRVYNSQLQYEPFVLKGNGRMEIHNGVKKTLQLDTDGLLHVREVKLDALTWPDFVFEPNYKLQTLNEIEAFIKEHKHLPNVPDAKTIETEGLNLAEMDKILMQKVEELTLYLIQQNKTLEEQAKKIKELELLLQK